MRVLSEWDGSWEREMSVNLCIFCWNLIRIDGCFILLLFSIIFHISEFVTPTHSRIELTIVGNRMKDLHRNQPAQQQNIIEKKFSFSHSIRNREREREWLMERNKENANFSFFIALSLYVLQSVVLLGCLLAFVSSSIARYFDLLWLPIYVWVSSSKLWFMFQHDSFFSAQHSSQRVLCPLLCMHF